MYILGIDPGFTGAVALFNTMTGSIDAVMDMPVYKNKKGRQELNLHRLFDILRPPANTQIRAVLEQVASRPGQGAPSTFRFGQGYGAVEMALAGHKIPVQYVTPTKWKKYFGLSKDKGVSRGLATQRFPEHSEAFQRVKDDGRAEACLIALYGAEVLLPSTSKT